MKQNVSTSKTNQAHLPPQRKVFVFSLFFFLVILIGGSTAFLLAMRQLVRNDTFQTLSRVIETRNLQFSSAFESQIHLAVNMAESPLIRAYIKNPADAELSRLALSELNAKRAFFPGNNIFWISDADKRYYFNDEYVYTLDPADPESAWYAPTLDQQERFSFNVNYDVGLKQTLCWLNVPVYDSNHIPIGIVGTGIDLTEYINILFSALDEEITLYLFNNASEITGAKDSSLMERKAGIVDVWGEAGRQMFSETQSLGFGETKTLIIGSSAYAVSRIYQLGWYIAVTRPVTIFMFINNAMIVFVALVVVILFIFIIFNVYIANILKPISLMLERMRDLTTEWKMSSRKLRYSQIFFVCFAFCLLIAISFIATNFILRRHLSIEMKELLRTAESTITSNLRESSTTLVEASFTMEQLIERGESQESLLDYLINITEWLHDNEELVYGFNGIYGYIRGEYLDGEKWTPPEDYVPQERPWFIAAKEHAGRKAETIPYVDAQTGLVVISFSREIFDKKAESLGVLSIDVLLDQIGAYVETLRLAESGYGILINQNFEIIAHPNKELVGKRFDSINGDSRTIQSILNGGRPVTAFSVTNFENIRHIAFFKQLDNGWYIGSMTPVVSYYSDVYIMDLILVLVGLVLVVSLILIISRQHRRIENYTDVAMQLSESNSRFVPVQFMKFLGVDSITNLKLGDCIQSSITVMFFDIRFFSVHSQMMSPHQTFDFVNKIFGMSGPIIQKHNGFVDKYLGDSAMVLFEHPGDALKAGIEIYRTLILDETTRVKNGMDGINIGIGVHTGSVMLGVIGDVEHYASTVISKHVNTASRIEGLTKQTKAGMLISSDVMQEIPENERDYEYRYLGLVNPAGSRETVGIFEILDVLPDDTRQQRLKNRELFESAVRNFHIEQYKIASERFMQVMEADSTDVCAKRYFEEAKANIDDPNALGVFSFNTK